MSIMPCIVMSALFSCTECTLVQTGTRVRGRGLKPAWLRLFVLNPPKCAESCSAGASLYYQAHLHMYRAYPLLFTSCCRCTFHPSDLRAPCFSSKAKTTPEAAIQCVWDNTTVFIFQPYHIIGLKTRTRGLSE